MIAEQTTRELIEAAQNGDKEAEAELLEHHGGLINRVASVYNKGFGCVPLEDLLQEGRLGMIVAIRRFDLKRKTKFCTYATYWILQHIQRACDRQPQMKQEPENRGLRGCQLSDDDGERVMENSMLFCDEPKEPIDLAPLLSFLPARDRTALSMYYGVCGWDYPHNYVEIGEHLKVSWQRARQMVERSIQRLRDFRPLAKQELHD
jgi:RNA polymerase sigma factor (sigma-70 family)